MQKNAQRAKRGSVGVDSTSVRIGTLLQVVVDVAVVAEGLCEVVNGKWLQLV